MSSKHDENRTQEAIVDYTAKLGELDRMSVSQLQRCFYDISGEATNSRNKKSLKKRVAQLLQSALDETNESWASEIEETAPDNSLLEETDSVENEDVEEEEITDTTEVEAEEFQPELEEAVEPVSIDLEDVEGIEDLESNAETVEADDDEGIDEIEDAGSPEVIEADNDAEESAGVEEIEESESDEETEPVETSDNETWANEAESTETTEEIEDDNAAEESANIEEIEENESTEESAPVDTSGNETITSTSKPRDPRLPEVGTVIVKNFKGVTHEVKVLEKGFDFEGTHYRSLSALAKKISGTTWNGYTFFGLAKRVTRNAEGDAA